MEWGYARVDFLPIGGTTCCFCNRPLKSEKGIVVVNHNGDEAYSGPSCAKRELGNPDERILDVARLALLVVMDDSPPPASIPPVPATKVTPPAPNAKNGSGAAHTPAIDPVIQYLRLRYEVMGKFKGNVSKAMREAYSNLKAFGELDSDSERMLAGVMRRASTDSTIFSDRNIRHCIGIEHWLCVAMAQTKPDRREYLSSMLDRLHSHWMLTEGQIGAINKWGEGIRRVAHDFPVLDTQAFSGVKKPDFMARTR